MAERRSGWFDWFNQQPVAKILLYYAALAALVAVLFQVRPTLAGVFTTDQFKAAAESMRGGEQVLTGGTGEGTSAGVAFQPPLEVAVDAVIMMLGSVLLMLPVAWVHILTRSRRGFSQSMVQTLIFLPLVVAGVLMLVQHNVALAFGLGGVVGAVSFRNRLEDPKDAIYVFVAIAVGLAAGVQVLAVAAAISIFFNIVVLLAWRFDFGRMPAQLEASIAAKRLERVKAAAGKDRGGREFGDLVDQQLLKSMTPDQLQALAERAAAQGRKTAKALDIAGPESEESEEKKPRFDSLLRITMQPDDAAAIRTAIEGVLEGQTKRWEFDKLGAGDGGRATATYRVRFKKSIPSTLVIEAMRRSVLPKVVTIDVREA